MNAMNWQLPEQFDTPLLRQAIEIWIDGGLAMPAIALVSLVMFVAGVITYTRLMGKRFEWSWRSPLLLAVLAYIAAAVSQIAGTEISQTTPELFAQLPIVSKAAAMDTVFHVFAVCAILWWLIGFLPSVAIGSKFAPMLFVWGYVVVFLAQAAALSESFTPFLAELMIGFGRALTDRIFLIGVGLAAVWATLNWLWSKGCADWPQWVQHPTRCKGPVGRLVRFATRGQNIDETTKLFDELRGQEVKPFDRDMLIMRVCIAAAPLLGLLGTVAGMIATFEALNRGSGGDETQQMVSDGISVALITTETGLVVALAGLFFQYLLSQKQQRYKIFIAHMETVCTQAVCQRLPETNAHT